MSSNCEIRKALARATCTVLVGIAAIGCNSDPTTKPDRSRDPVVEEVDTTPSATVDMSANAEVSAAPASQRSSSAPLRASITDRAGDVVDGNYGKHPERKDLDIRRVGLAEADGGVSLVVTLGGPPTADIIYAFLACDSTGNGCSSIEVRRDRNGDIEATWYPVEDIQIQPLEGAAFFNGSTLRIEIPDEALVTPPPFEWSLTVATRSDAVEIADRAPNETEANPTTMAKFG